MTNCSVTWGSLILMMHRKEGVQSLKFRKEFVLLAPLPLLWHKVGHHQKRLSLAWWSFEWIRLDCLKIGCTRKQEFLWKGTSFLGGAQLCRRSLGPWRPETSVLPLPLCSFTPAEGGHYYNSVMKQSCTLRGGCQHFHLYGSLEFGEK